MTKRALLWFVGWLSGCAHWYHYYWPINIIFYLSDTPSVNLSARMSVLINTLLWAGNKHVLRSVPSHSLDFLLKIRDHLKKEYQFNTKKSLNEASVENIRIIFDVGNVGSCGARLVPGGACV